MNGTQVRELQGRRTNLLLEARDSADAAEREDRPLSTEEREHIEQLVREVGEINGRLTQFDADASLRQQIAALGQGIDRQGGSANPSTIRNGPAPRGTAGQQFTASRVWTDYLANIATPGGHIPEKTPINSPRISLATSFLPRPYRNEVIIEGDPESGGAFIIPQQTGIVSPLPMRELTLLNLITIGETTSDAVQYVRITSVTGAASGVAESTTVETPSPANAAGGVKPELGMTFERVTANVQNIAGWMPATTRMLSDAAQIRTIIDMYLRSAVQEEAERQALLGTGTGEEIEGIDVAHTLDQPYSATVTDLDPLLETTRKALTKIQLARGITPQAFVFHPTDWEAIDLARMVKNPNNEAASGSNRVLHGYPVVLNEMVDEGTAWVGDFRWYVLWMREDVSIVATSGYMDFFTRNMVAILGEERAAGGLIRTDAVCKIDLTA